MAETEAGRPVPSVEELDTLSTDELRDRAFQRAERHHDIGFFWDLLRHLPSSEEFAVEDGSAGHIGGSISELVELFRAVTGGGLGEVEPLFRARFIDYIRKGG